MRITRVQPHNVYGNVADACNLIPFGTIACTHIYMFCSFDLVRHPSLLSPTPLPRDANRPTASAAVICRCSQQLCGKQLLRCVPRSSHDLFQQCHRTLTDASHPWCTKACRNAYNTAATARGEVCQVSFLSSVFSQTPNSQREIAMQPEGKAPRSPILRKRLPGAVQEVCRRSWGSLRGAPFARVASAVTDDLPT